MVDLTGKIQSVYYTATSIDPSPDSLLLQGCHLHLLVVVGGKVAAEVAIVVDERWIVFVARETAILVPAVGCLVNFVGDFPDAFLRQHLHKVLHMTIDLEKLPQSS